MVDLTNGVYRLMNESYTEFSALVKGLLDPKFSSDYERIETWTSMQSLIVVSSIDEHYDLVVTYEELHACNTLKDLFEVLKNKQA